MAILFSETPKKFSYAVKLASAERNGTSMRANRAKEKLRNGRRLRPTRPRLPHTSLCRRGPVKQPGEYQKSFGVVKLRQTLLSEIITIEWFLLVSKKRPVANKRTGGVIG